MPTGDQLVGAASGVSVPLADILRLEVWGFSLGRTIGVGFGVYAAVVVVVLGLWALENR